MKRLVSWLTGLVVMAGLVMGLVLPQAAYADEIRNVADDKIA